MIVGSFMPESCLILTQGLTGYVLYHKKIKIKKKILYPRDNESNLT